MFRIKKGYKIHNLLDTYVIVGTNAASYRPSEIMSLNETGAFLWNILVEGADEAALIQKLTDEFDTDAETAKNDVNSFIGRIPPCRLIGEA